MKCNQCGFEAAQDSLFCPQCGERMVQDASGRSGFADQLLPALKDPLFLVVCILLSISCLLSLSAGSVPLIDILITVFLWLTYAQARKDIADAGHLRCVSGALYAQYRKLADGERNVVFGGRLGEYKYYDMDQTVAAALRLCEGELG